MYIDHTICNSRCFFVHNKFIIFSTIDNQFCRLSRFYLNVTTKKEYDENINSKYINYYEYLVFDHTIIRAYHIGGKIPCNFVTYSPDFFDILLLQPNRRRGSARA
mgnify:CR=1 FL=1